MNTCGHPSLVHLNYYFRKVFSNFSALLDFGVPKEHFLKRSQEDSGTWRIFLAWQKSAFQFLCVLNEAVWRRNKRGEVQIPQASTRRVALRQTVTSSICCGLVGGQGVSRGLCVSIIYPLSPQTALWRKDCFYQPHFIDKEITAKSPSWIHTIWTTGNLSVALWRGRYCSKWAREETRAFRNWGEGGLKLGRWNQGHRNSSFPPFISPCNSTMHRSKNDDLRHFHPDPKELSPNQFSKLSKEGVEASAIYLL